MAWAKARTCIRNIYFIMGVVTATVTLMYLFPVGQQGSTQEMDLHKQHSPNMRTLSVKRSLGEENTAATLSEHRVPLEKADGGDDIDDNDDDDGDAVADEDNNVKGRVRDAIRVGGEGKEAKVVTPPVVDGETNISDKEQYRLNMEDLEIKEERVHKKRSRKVIIMTYMRSGSTMTGDFFQRHPDVFYVFEPLWRLQKFYNNENHVISYLNGNAIRDRFLPSEFWTRESMSTQTLKNMLSCNLKDLDIETLRMAHMVTSKCTRPYSQCLYFHPKKRSVEAIKDCFPLLQRPCSNAKVTVVKTIRYTMEQLEYFLNSDPDVKVIHLFRDPRGTLFSQYRVGEFKWPDRKPAFEEFCNRMLRDLRHSYDISKRYPNRILMVRYEDIVQYPIASAKFMYDFVGLEMTEEIKSYIWNITYAGSTDKTCTMLCTTKANSTSTAYRWRRYLSFPDVKLMDSKCKHVYDFLGYRAFGRMWQYITQSFQPKLKHFGQQMKYVKLMTLKELEAMPESQIPAIQKGQENKVSDSQKQNKKSIDFVKEGAS